MHYQGMDLGQSHKGLHRRVTCTTSVHIAKLGALSHFWFRLAGSEWAMLNRFVEKKAHC